MKFKNIISLSNNVKIYIPSTMNVDEKLNSNEIKVIVDDTLKMMSGFFGGATTYNTLGCYSSTSGKLIKEKVTICESYCKESDLEKHIEKIIDYCNKLKTTLKQESIAIEVNNVLYLI